jgi:hypothetical protein
MNPLDIQPFDDTTIKDLTTKISKAVWLLRCWRALDYTGHFINVNPEMKERINEVSENTQKHLTDDWGFKEIP